ncbi:hypothetical protein NDU88_006469 [Pleurodeles waltl]|uniref:Uncharacterized protein n=1 Tax=Pleurodeles waltl TaxID=8319 RepID=A0AAV7TDL9_PLEWA|nr:hypothetical protein NDU88_006469 [Pleurodeles waltl]
MKGLPRYVQSVPGRVHRMLESKPPLTSAIVLTAARRWSSTQLVPRYAAGRVQSCPGELQWQSQRKVLSAALRTKGSQRTETSILDGKFGTPFEKEIREAVRVQGIRVTVRKEESEVFRNVYWFKKACSAETEQADNQSQWDEDAIADNLGPETSYGTTPARVSAAPRQQKRTQTGAGDDNLRSPS